MTPPRENTENLGLIQSFYAPIVLKNILLPIVVLTLVLCLLHFVGETFLIYFVPPIFLEASNVDTSLIRQAFFFPSLSVLLFGYASCYFLGTRMKVVVAMHAFEREWYLVIVQGVYYFIFYFLFVLLFAQILSYNPDRFLYSVLQINLLAVSQLAAWFLGGFFLTQWVMNSSKSSTTLVSS